MNKVRRELQLFVKMMHELYTIKPFKTSECATLTVYQYKPKKNVCIISSMHLSSITASEKRYPETVLYDNQPKCRVDVADQMNRLYSVKTGARR